MRLHAKKVQVNRLASCHGNMSLVSIYGAPGYFIPEFFELKQLEPDPIDYDWSAELAKQST